MSMQLKENVRASRSCTVALQILLAAFICFAQPPYTYTNAQLQTLLPTPVIDDHPEWLNMYWFCWQIARNHIYKGTAGNGFVPYYMDECFSPYIYQWDDCFMMMFGRYAAYCWPSIVTLENFYMNQASDGYIARELSEADASPRNYDGVKNNINPPIFSWAEWEHFLYTNDSSRFTKVIKSRIDGSNKTILDRLIKYYQWIDQPSSVTDANPIGRKRAATGLYWNTGFGSGMDNTARTGDNWIDMSAQMAMNAYYISKIATVAGNRVAADTFMNVAFNRIRNLINTKMWDPTDKFYYDIMDNGTFTKHRTIASSWPLVARVADSARAWGVINILTNPAQFWRLCPFPTLGASEPEYQSGGGYWLGSVWPPTNYEAIKGIELFSDSIAKAATEKYLTHTYKIFQNTGSVWENLSADYVAQGSQSMRDFVGWGGVGPISLLIENMIGLSFNAPENTVTWKISLLKRNGLTNMHFGDKTVSLTCADRVAATDDPVLTITTNAPFTLIAIVRSKGLKETRVIPAGTSTWTVSATGIVQKKSHDQHARYFTRERIASVYLDDAVPSANTRIPVDIYAVNGKKIAVMPANGTGNMRAIRNSLPAGVLFASTKETR